MGEAKRKSEQKKDRGDDRLQKALKDTFPASDPPAETEPGSGITGVEPPPEGQKRRDA